MRLEIKILDKKFYSYDSGLGGASNSGYDIPRYATRDSAGLDLRTTKDVRLRPGEQATISTGLAIHIGSGEGRGFGVQDIVGIIAPRSSLGARGLSLQNTIGIIDADYTGEILLKIYNHNKEDSLYIEAGERVAQLLLVPILKAHFNVVDEFTEITERNSGGFGSSGSI